MRALSSRLAGLTGCFTFTPTWFLILDHNPSASVNLRNTPHSFPSRSRISLTYGSPSSILNALPSMRNCFRSQEPHFRVRTSCELPSVLLRIPRVVRGLDIWYGGIYEPSRARGKEACEVRG